MPASADVTGKGCGDQLYRSASAKHKPNGPRSRVESGVAQPLREPP